MSAAADRERELARWTMSYRAHTATALRQRALLGAQWERVLAETPAPNHRRNLPPRGLALPTAWRAYIERLDGGEDS